VSLEDGTLIGRHVARRTDDHLSPLEHLGPPREPLRVPPSGRVGRVFHGGQHPHVAPFSDPRRCAVAVGIGAVLHDVRAGDRGSSAEPFEHLRRDVAPPGGSQEPLGREGDGFEDVVAGDRPREIWMLEGIRPQRASLYRVDHPIMPSSRHARRSANLVIIGRSERR
jgi:hypothetical protein